jgi:hypothetical protein
MRLAVLQVSVHISLDENTHAHILLDSIGLLACTNTRRICSEDAAHTPSGQTRLD